MTQRGPVEREARRYVRDMGDLDGPQRPLAELAYVLARALDQGAGMAAAAISKEYRATLDALREVGDDRNAGADLQARLSAPMGDPEVPGAPDVGGSGGRGGGDAGDTPDALAARRRRRGTGDRPG